MTIESPLHPQPLIGSNTYFFSLYFITAGTLYLWGYWSTFGVNILEYLSIGDIVMSAAHPIASTFAFFILGVALSEMAGGKKIPSQGGPTTRLGRFIINYRTLIGTIYVLGILAIFFLAPVQKWLILPGLVAIPAGAYLLELGALESMPISRSMRSLLTFLLAALPLYAFGIGVLKANDIIEGKKFEYILSAIDDIPFPANPDPTKNVRFLGHAGNFLFLWEPENSAMMISKFEEGKTLRLGRFERP